MFRLSLKNIRVRGLLASVSLAAVLSLPIMAFAANCCGWCGCECVPQRYCRVVCEIKKVPKVTYSYEQEDFCVPGPSEKVNCHFETVPAHFRPNCTREKRVWDWLPGCAEVKTRTRLVKKVVEKEEKTYKWVVDYVCGDCAQQGHPPAETAKPNS